MKPMMIRMIIPTCMMAFVLMAPNLATAKKVYSPIVKQGEIELETQNEIFRSKDPAKNGKAKYQIELSAGVTNNWHSGVYAVYEKEAGATLQYTQTKWANIIQLTESDKYWLNLGLYAEYIWMAPNNNKSDLLELKVLLEKPIQKWKHTLNVVFKQPLWGNVTSTSFGYAWRSRYKMDSGLEPGIEAYGSLGTLDQMNVTQQTHLVGPVVEYKVTDTLEVNLAWLMDTNEGMAYGDFKFNIEVEF